MHKTILVVDFDPKCLDDIQRFFQDEKITLLTASDGTRALEIFQAENPDLVLTAALLPKLNGFELCKKITGGEVGEVRPVIMFSEIYKAEKYRKEAIIGCGAVDFLEKPLVKAQLLRAIENLFSEIPSGKAVTQTQIESASAPAKIAYPSSEVDVGQSGDLLELNKLLETVSSCNSGMSLAHQEESTLLETTIPGPGPFLIVPEGEDEIDAAVDAIRLDLDAETRVPVPKAALEIETAFHLPRDGQDILEFDAMQIQAVEKLRSQPPETVEIIEFEVPLAKPGIEAASDLNRGKAPDRMADQEIEGADVITPPVALRHQEPRNWVPFIALILAALLIIFFYWLGAR